MSGTEFKADLARWGPQAGTAADPAAARAYCRRLAFTHYENFPLLSWLLPRRLRQHFCNVYAYCRWADDLGDEVEGAEQSLELLAWWRRELDACFAGNAWHPVFVALRETLEEFRIPRRPFADLLSAFEQDQRVREYETFEELSAYCRLSADPVGRIVLYLCDASCEQHAAWSDSICTGLQLANFWQDVSRDFELGRIYLPREDYERFGYRRTDFDRRVTNAAFVELMQFEVDRARACLLGGLPLVSRLPGRLQIDVDLFARGGLRILSRIERIGCRVWETRPVVTKWDACGLLLESILRTIRRRWSQ